ncbi:hypothetical protein P3X46_004609 [Hevea brasiliensis]|uniref:Uncharacterized protein n=1 Tax=Hevea brasiliensis TaxID=3981 RepID=A0ABQ9MXB9_HEVBR|nr:hypothetical protein P3X46_004609 [Hevea brasiliensis]
MPSPRTSSKKMGSLFKTIKSSSYKLLSKSTDVKAKTPHVRRGHIPMYVGDEGKRYQVPVENLRFPGLQELIKQSLDDDLDSKIDGPIVLACTTDEFDQILKLAEGY